MIDNILSVIKKIENDIGDKFKRVKELENDYEELILMKEGLNKTLEKYQENYNNRRKILKTSNLESNRCMQKFLEGMDDLMTDSKISKYTDELLKAISVVSNQGNTTLNDIKSEENNIQYLQADLEMYRGQLSSVEYIEG